MIFGGTGLVIYSIRSCGESSAIERSIVMQNESDAEKWWWLQRYKLRLNSSRLISGEGSPLIPVGANGETVDLVITISAPGHSSNIYYLSVHRSKYPFLYFHLSIKMGAYSNWNGQSNVKITGNCIVRVYTQWSGLPHTHKMYTCTCSVLVFDELLRWSFSRCS